MMLLGFRQLSEQFVRALLVCHGGFGSLHLLAYPPQCASDAEHQAKHQATAGASDAHEHPAGHGTSPGYFAVLVGLLGLLLGLLPKGAPLRIRLEARWPVVLRRVPAVLRPPPAPTPLTLQVFRL